MRWHFIYTPKQWWGFARHYLTYNLTNDSTSFPLFTRRMIEEMKMTLHSFLCNNFPCQHNENHCMSDVCFDCTKNKNDKKWNVVMNPKISYFIYLIYHSLLKIPVQNILIVLSKIMIKLWKLLMQIFISAQCLWPLDSSIKQESGNIIFYYHLRDLPF